MSRTPTLLLILGFLIIGVGFFRLFGPSLVPESTGSPAAPRITQPLVRASDPKRGNTFAPITLVEFADFSCEACATFQTAIDAVMKKFPTHVLFVWKDFPLPNHPFARAQHVAARCALEQGKFWEFHDSVFKHTPTTDNDHIRIAQELKLNMTTFTDCLKNKTILQTIDESFAEGEALDITETPTVFINDKRINGSVSAASLTRMVQDLLDTQSK